MELNGAAVTDRRRLVPIANRRQIEKVFGMPPATLPVAKILAPSRRVGWPDLDKVLAPRPPSAPRRSKMGSRLPPAPPRAPELRLLHRWLDTWTGLA